MTATKTRLRNLDRSLPMALLRAREAAMSHFRPMLREHKLTEQQWRVMRVLAEYSEVEATELAQLSFLLAPSLTRILQTLEQKRLIKRKVSVEDQRRQRVSLSIKGQKLFQSIAPESEALYRSFERRFGRQNMDTLYALLEDFRLVGSEDDV